MNLKFDFSMSLQEFCKVNNLPFVSTTLKLWREVSKEKHSPMKWDATPLKQDEEGNWTREGVEI